MHNFRVEIANDLWERFKERAVREHGSPRQAILFLVRSYADRPEGEPQNPPQPGGDQGDPDATRQ